MNAQTQTATIRTKLTTYSYDVSKPAEAAEYERLRARLEKRGSQCFATASDCRPGKGYCYAWVPAGGISVGLKTSHIFNNQWNTAPRPELSGRAARVFDWAEDIFPNPDIKSGHYLGLNAGMRAIRQTTLKCGFCATNYPGGHTTTWCTACIDGPHLKQSDLPLLVLAPAGASLGAKRPVLSAKDLAALVAAYVEAQTVGKGSRAVAHRGDQRRAVLEKAQHALAAAAEERDGMLWLLDHKLSLDNVMYYSHTRRFSFGWRTPLSSDVVEALVDALRVGLPGEFPFHYDIKT